MRPLFLCLFCALSSVGCVIQSTPSQPAADPFQWNDSQPEQPYYVPPSPQCPDGGCPWDDDGDCQSLGTEVGKNDGVPVNVIAANEVKGDCPTCVKPLPTASVPLVLQRTLRNGIYLNPGERLLSVGPSVHPGSGQTSPRTMPGAAAQAPQKKTTDNSIQSVISRQADANTKREGRFVCSKCLRPTIGKQWHELWADDDTPLTCLCEQCWAQMTPAERVSVTTNYALQTTGKLLSPVVTSAIKEAAKK